MQIVGVLEVFEEDLSTGVALFFHLIFRNSMIHMSTKIEKERNVHLILKTTISCIPIECMSWKEGEPGDLSQLSLQP